MLKTWIIIAAAGLLISGASGASGKLLPPLPPPEEYGNILIDRTSARNGVKPVTFSHWIHRRKHTCRVCHGELEFIMKLGSTEISEAANGAGKFCGACHDGKAAFGQEQCRKCHNGEIGYGREKFSELLGLPKTGYGNKINWVKALRKGMIKPTTYLRTSPVDIQLDKTLLLQAEMNLIPPAIFPHKAHTEWLDCNSCHPDIFNIKKKTTKHFSMHYILNGEFCGVCHMKVAFPIDDCRRCHPAMEQNRKL